MENECSPKHTKGASGALYIHNKGVGDSAQGGNRTRTKYKFGGF